MKKTVIYRKCVFHKLVTIAVIIVFSCQNIALAGNDEDNCLASRSLFKLFEKKGRTLAQALDTEERLLTMREKILSGEIRHDILEKIDRRVANRDFIKEIRFSYEIEIIEGYRNVYLMHTNLYKDEYGDEQIAFFYNKNNIPWELLRKYGVKNDEDKEYAKRGFWIGHHMRLYIREDLADSDGNKLWREKEWTAEELLQREPDSIVAIDESGNVVFDSAFIDKIRQEFGLNENDLGYTMTILRNIFRMRKRRYFPRYHRFPPRAVKLYFVNESQSVSGDGKDNNVAFINLKVIKELGESFVSLYLGIFLSHEILGHEMGIHDESLLSQQDAELVCRREYSSMLTHLCQGLVRIFKPDSLFIVELKKLSEDFYLLHRMGIKKGDTLVYVGGANNTAIAIATGYMGGHYIGYEIDKRVWQAFDERFWEKDRSSEFGGSIKQFQGEFSYGSQVSGNLPDHSVDYVLMFGVLSNPTPETDVINIFKEALRVVKNGGKIVAGSYMGSWYAESPKHRWVIEGALDSPEWKGKIKLRVTGRGNSGSHWYIEYLVEFLDEGKTEKKELAEIISHAYERLQSRYRRFISKDLLISIVSSGKLPEEWPLVDDEDKEITAAISGAVENAARGIELTDKVKVLIAKAISAQFFIDREKVIEKIKKDLNNLGYGVWLDEIIKKFIEITKRDNKEGISGDDWNFILFLEWVLRYSGFDMSGNVRIAKTSPEIDWRIRNLEEYFRSNIKQWDLLYLATGKKPAGVIVQNIKDLGLGVENWKEGLERHDIDESGVEMVYIIGDVDSAGRARLLANKPPDVRLVNSIEDVQGKNIIYLAGKEDLDKVKRDGVLLVERGYAGPILELNLCLLLLGTSDVEGAYRMFIDELEKWDIISEYEKDMFLRDVKSSVYIRLPKIDKVHKMWNELEKDITYLDVWA